MFEQNMGQSICFRLREPRILNVNFGPGFNLKQSVYLSSRTLHSLPNCTLRTDGIPRVRTTHTDHVKHLSGCVRV